MFRKKDLFATCPCCGHWLTCVARKRYPHRRLYFSNFILPEIRTGSLSIKFRCSRAINKFRTGTLYRILNHLTEYIKVSGNYRQLFVKDRKEKRPFLRKQANITKEYLIISGKYVNLYQNTVSNFARLLGVSSSDYNPEHVNSPRRKASF